MIEASGVELDELHIGHPNTGAVPYGDTVPGGDIRIAGITINLTGTSCAKNGNFAQEGNDPVVFYIKDIGPPAGLLCLRINNAALDQLCFRRWLSLD